ncbi:hypothetical protein CAOG_009651 [Capsaspora owczarzaki ATCC 30864]|uniref:Uncharacterized protein n=1 Tax=Capsaspora owczarzaki (strain ATCC 30864) TaxID=595528 RepID=A0A0D2X2C3_CAPO3|nr:hypothetical protein CAOG_009651 [Capsaspora owczarzaki ATCC 30864]
MTTILSPLPASEQMTHHPDTRFHHLAEDAVKPLPLDMPLMAHSLDDTFSSSSSEPTTNADSKDSSSLDSSFELACQDVKLACHDDAATVDDSEAQYTEDDDEDQWTNCDDELESILEAIGQLREEMGAVSQKVDAVSRKVDAITAQITDVQKDVKDVQILQGAMTEAHFEVLTRNSQLVYNMKFASLEKALKAGVALLKTNAQSASLFELKDVQSHARKIAKRLYDSGYFLRFMYEVISVVAKLPSVVGTLLKQEELAALFKEAESKANALFGEMAKPGSPSTLNWWANIKSSLGDARGLFSDLVDQPALKAKLHIIWSDNCDSQAAVFEKLLCDAATEFQDMCNKATNSAFPPPLSPKLHDMLCGKLGLLVAVNIYTRLKPTLNLHLGEVECDAMAPLDDPVQPRVGIRLLEVKTNPDQREAAERQLLIRSALFVALFQLMPLRSVDAQIPIRIRGLFYASGHLVPQDHYDEKAMKVLREAFKSKVFGDARTESVPELSFAIFPESEFKREIPAWATCLFEASSTSAESAPVETPVEAPVEAPAEVPGNAPVEAPVVLPDVVVDAPTEQQNAPAALSVFAPAAAAAAAAAAASTQRRRTHGALEASTSNSVTSSEHEEEFDDDAPRQLAKRVRLESTVVDDGSSSV